MTINALSIGFILNNENPKKIIFILFVYVAYTKRLQLSITYTRAVDNKLLYPTFLTSCFQIETRKIKKLYFVELSYSFNL